MLSPIELAHLGKNPRHPCNPLAVVVARSLDFVDGAKAEKDHEEIGLEHHGFRLCHLIDRVFYALTDTFFLVGQFAYGIVVLRQFGWPFAAFPRAGFQNIAIAVYDENHVIPAKKHYERGLRHVAEFVHRFGKRVEIHGSRDSCEVLAGHVLPDFVLDLIVEVYRAQNARVGWLAHKGTGHKYSRSGVEPDDVFPRDRPLRRIDEHLPPKGMHHVLALHP